MFGRTPLVVANDWSAAYRSGTPLAKTPRYDAGRAGRVILTG